MNLLLVLSMLVNLHLSAGKQGLPVVLIKTSLGEIELVTDTVGAPITAKNFLKHVESGTYESASFYRVVRMNNQAGNAVKIEVIQGGLLHDEQVNKHPVIEHETTNRTGLKHTSGAVSMARNEPGTASTEFFICIGNQPELDFGGKRNPDGQGFAVFGRVIRGMDVVRAIQQLSCEGQYLKTPVVFSATIKKE